MTPPRLERLPGTPAPAASWGPNGRLTGDVWGEPGATSIILLHGGGQTRHAWQGTGERLAAQGYHVIAYDARGHGDSFWEPDGDYSQDAMVGDLVDVVAGSGASEPVLVGASMGGETSLVACGERAVDASALVLVDIAHRLELDGVAKIQAFMSQSPDGFETLDDVATAIAAYQPHRNRPRQLDGLAKNVRQDERGRYRWHWDPRFLTATRDLMERQRRLEASAAALELPTLLVRGALSDVVSVEGVREFLALCPHAESVDVAAAAHMVAGDRNDLFGREVVAFLERVRPAPVQAHRRD